MKPGRISPGRMTSLAPALLGLALVLTAATRPTTAAERPHVVLILADDFGRELLPSYGGQSYELPHLSRLARESVQFDVCYATPLCAPSRVELMTGLYSFRGYDTWGELDPRLPTLAQAMQSQGYRTVAAGKWHMGGWDASPPGIVAAGFERYCSFNYVDEIPESKAGGGNRYWGGSILHGTAGDATPTRGRLAEYGPDRFAREITDAIAATADDPRPLFAYYGLNLLHRPFHPTPHHPEAPAPGQSPPAAWLTDKGSPEHFPAMVAYVDEIVGRIDAALAEAGIRDETLFIVTSDNGTDNVHEAATVRSRWQPSMRGEVAEPVEVAGGKYFPTELGLNVPLLVRYPGVFPPRRTRALVDFTDLTATICLAAEADPPPHCDGRDLASLLMGQTDTHKSYVWSFGNFEQSSRRYKDPRQYGEYLFDVVRGERHKWIGPGSVGNLREPPRRRRGQLFDLVADPLEAAGRHRDAADGPTWNRLKRHTTTLRESSPARW